jgi:hypothetical protein
MNLYPYFAHLLFDLDDIRCKKPDHNPAEYFKFREKKARQERPNFS